MDIFTFIFRFEYHPDYGVKIWGELRLFNVIYMPQHPIKDLGAL